MCVWVEGRHHFLSKQNRKTRLITYLGHSQKNKVTLLVCFMVLNKVRTWNSMWMFVRDTHWSLHCAKINKQLNTDKTLSKLTQVPSSSSGYMSSISAFTDSLSTILSTQTNIVCLGCLTISLIVLAVCITVCEMSLSICIQATISLLMIFKFILNCAPLYVSMWAL